MKTLALSNGDLVVGHVGHEVLTGSSKIRQDLALALGERLGNDRFHPSWGSVLPMWIGQPIDESTPLEVRSEVARVINHYIATRDEYILEDKRLGSKSRFDTSDIVRSVTGIKVRVDLDNIRVSVSLLTVAGTKITINRTVTA